MERKSVLFFFNLCYLTNAAFAADVEKHLSSEILDDYKGIPIVGSTGLHSDEEDSVSTITIEENFIQKLAALPHEENSTKKLILRYATSALNDITFHEITEKLLPLLPTEKASHERFILDLSYNGITEASAADIQKWASHSSIAYIAITGNPNISKRNIKRICSAIIALTGGDLAAKKEAVRQVLSKVVFLSRYYINTAKTRVKIYQELEEKEYLSRDWDLKQKEFYRVIENASDLSFSEEYFQDSIDEAANAKEFD